MARTGDLFEGVFDNRITGCREVWRDGEMRRFARRNAVGTDETQWRELHAPWGHYPDLPANAGRPNFPLTWSNEADPAQVQVTSMPAGATTR
ncbi:MAG: hypothetical protein ABW154_14270 [Dyella sp.]